MYRNYSRRLFSNFVALGIVQGANFLVPLLVMPYVIRKIGIDGLGLVSLAQILMIYLSVIGDYGFNLTATRDVALHKGDDQRVSKIFWTVLLSRMVLIIGLFLLLIALLFFIPYFRNNAYLYLLAFTYVIGQSLMTHWFFQGMERMQYITITTLFGRAIFVALVFIFIRGREDHILFLFFLGLGNVIAGIIGIILAARLFRLTIQPVSLTDIRKELKDGWQITVSNLSINTYLYVNVLILRIFTSDQIVGFYSIAEKIFFAMRQILGVFSQVVYPRVCQLVYKTQVQLVSFFKEIYLPFLLLVIAGCTMLFIFSANIVYFFAGAIDELPVTLLRILSFVPVIVCLNIPAYQILLALNQKKSYLQILVLGTVINFFINILLASTWGAKGTVTCIIITELFITIGLNRQLYKKNFLNFIKTGTT